MHKGGRRNTQFCACTHTQEERCSYRSGAHLNITVPVGLGWNAARFHKTTGNVAWGKILHEFGSCKQFNSPRSKKIFRGDLVQWGGGGDWPHKRWNYPGVLMSRCCIVLVSKLSRVTLCCTAFPSAKHLITDLNCSTEIPIVYHINSKVSLIAELNSNFNLNFNWVEHSINFVLFPLTHPPGQAVELNLWLQLQLPTNT